MQDIVRANRSVIIQAWLSKYIGSTNALGVYRILYPEKTPEIIAQEQEAEEREEIELLEAYLAYHEWRGRYKE